MQSIRKKTKQELLGALTTVRQRVAELETLVSRGDQAADAPNRLEGLRIPAENYTHREQFRLFGKFEKTNRRTTDAGSYGRMVYVRGPECCVS